VNQYALVAIEDLSMAFMNQNKHLAFSSYDAGFGLFRELLTYKAETAEVQIIAVDPAYTSQLCSGCGERVEKDLNTRVHDCPFCGLVMDRDVNAARNILQAALQVLNSPD
jgi:putative transposase